MLSQTLSIHSTTAAAAALLHDWRTDMGNLAHTELPVSLVVYDLLRAIGLPENAIRLVLTTGELALLDDAIAPLAPVARCQSCGEEATRLVNHHRRGKLLLCDPCAVKLETK